MNINCELYKDVCNDWDKISLLGFPKYDSKDVVSGKYEINVIQRKIEDEEYGKIKKEIVKV